MQVHCCSPERYLRPGFFSAFLAIKPRTFIGLPVPWLIFFERERLRTETKLAALDHHGSPKGRTSVRNDHAERG